MLRIMTFNIRCSDVRGVTWEERRPLVSEQIRCVHPDSVGVQEAHEGWMTYLREALKDEYVSVGVGREDGKNEGEYSAIFYLKEKYALIDSGNFWLSETPDKPSKGWDAAYTRICTWARLREKISGWEYVHINTHFDHIGRIAQQNSVSMIHKKVAEFTDLPVVFTADLNIFEGGEIYEDMVSSQLKDAKFLAPDTMSYLTFHNGRKNPRRKLIIDYVLVNSLLKPQVYRVLAEGIDGKMVSDHYPVYVDCE